MYICRLLKRRRKSFGGPFLMTFCVIVVISVWPSLKFYQRTLLASSVGDFHQVDSSAVSDDSNTRSFSVTDVPLNASSASTSVSAIGIGETTSGAAPLSQASVAEMVAERKILKYATLSTNITFQPVAFETLGPINQSGVDFSSEIGRRLEQASGSGSLVISPCDEECSRFKKYFDSWPEGKPKAAIYFLIRQSSLKILPKSLGALDRFFNNEYRYPLIMFFEKDLSSKQDQDTIRSMTNSTVFMQLVEFNLPSFLTKPVPQIIRGKKRNYDIGYRHMCRFHAKLVYEQTIMVGLEYAWRLDDDSFFTRPIKYDVFAHMKQLRLTYGFVKTYLELPMWTTGLWKTTKNYIADNKLQTQFFNKWPRNFMYYNNFEVSEMSLWMSTEYRKYIEHIDRQGGIYYHRWGDAPIKSIAVAMFVPRNKTFNFKDIGYIHQFFRRP